MAFAGPSPSLVLVYMGSEAGWPGLVILGMDRLGTKWGSQWLLNTHAKARNLKPPARLCRNCSFISLCTLAGHQPRVFVRLVPACPQDPRYWISYAGLRDPKIV